jgi:hypothetical protein
MRLYVLLATAWLASLTFVYLKGRLDGSGSCDLRHERAQVTQERKVRKQDAKRDREKPVTTDRDKLLEWLFQYGGE